MWFRRKTDQLLNEPRRLSTADYLCRLMEEQNSLLRELLHVQGYQARTIKARPVAVDRIRTEKDVIRITRETVLQQEAQKQEQTDAPWRNGRDSDATASTSGSTPNGQESAPEASNPRPSAP